MRINQWLRSVLSPRRLKQAAALGAKNAGAVQSVAPDRLTLRALPVVDTHCHLVAPRSAAEVDLLLAVICLHFSLAQCERQLTRG